MSPSTGNHHAKSLYLRSNGVGLHFQHRKCGFTLIELVIACAVIALMCILTIKVTSAVGTQTKTASCAHNLRQIWVAIKLYADDHQGLLPGPSYQAITYASPSVPDALAAYTGGSEGLWDCPARPVLREYRRTGYLQGSFRDDAGVSHQYFGYPERHPSAAVPPVRFIRLSQITNPAQRWLLADADAIIGSLPANIAEIAPHPPHSHKRNSLMVDGRVTLTP